MGDPARKNMNFFLEWALVAREKEVSWRRPQNFNFCTSTILTEFS